MFREAKEFLQKEQPHADSEVGRLVVCGAYTLLYFVEMDFPKTVDYGLKYIRQCQKIDGLPEQERNVQMIILVEKFYQDRNFRNVILCYLFVAGLRLGDTEPMERYFSMLEFSEERVFLAANLLEELLNAMERFESPYFYEVAQFLLGQKLIAGEICSSLARREQAAEPGFEKLVPIFASCGSDQPYILHLRELQELYTLADSLCTNARRLWEQGDETNARNILSQVRKLVPGYRIAEDLSAETMQTGKEISYGK
jgi:hypothetical protein